MRTHNDYINDSINISLLARVLERIYELKTFGEVQQFVIHRI